ncbi:MAG: DNA polymerase III subunit delta [Candidatus Acidiferrales bacterium]|jgi:DNA polymerase-3 subunit delta
MPRVAAGELLAHIAKGRPVPAILLLGDEPYLRDACRAQLLEAYVPEDARDWGVSRYSCADNQLNAALAQAQTLPMLCSTQVVFLEEVDALESLPEKEREKAAEHLASYLEDPAAFTVLVLEAARLDQRMKLAKLLLEETLSVDVGLSDDPGSRRDTAVAMAKSMAKELGARFEQGAAEELVELVNGELTLLKTEIDKLAAHALPSGAISQEAVGTLVISSKKYTVWQLADMMATQQSRRAIEFLAALIREGEEPVALVGALAWMVRKLIEAAELAPSTTGWQAARALAMRPEAAEAAVRNAHRIPRARLLDGLRALCEADNRLKSANPNPRAVLEFLVCRLAGG